MKATLIILAVIALPSAMLILTSLSGIYFFGGAFLTCLISGYFASRAFDIQEEGTGDSKEENTNL